MTLGSYVRITNKMGWTDCEFVHILLIFMALHYCVVKIHYCSHDGAK